jgi:cobalamin biosynthesis protein CobT
MLDNSGRSDLDGGRKAGSIDTRAIHRAAYDDRIFARRVEIAGIDTALYVLVDHSGSMAGSWIRTARNVTSAVYKAGIEAQASVAVGVFDSYPATIIPFGAGRKGIDLISRIEACGSTSMALAVRHALRTLIDRPEPRRILLVITDAHVGDDDASETRSLIAGGDRIGIQTLGIGIGRDISHGFADSSVIFEIGDLGPAAFAGLSKAIRRAA